MKEIRNIELIYNDLDNLFPTATTCKLGFDASLTGN